MIFAEAESSMNFAETLSNPYTLKQKQPQTTKTITTT
jgi:hypothetical protein